MRLTQLDDGSVVTDYVSPEGPAAKAGIRAGATLLRHDGRTLPRALADVSLLWASPIPSTPVVRRLQQLRYLLRAPVDARVSLLVRNPGRSRARTVMLRAAEDNYDGCQDERTAPVEQRV